MKFLKPILLKFLSVAIRKTEFGKLILKGHLPGKILEYPEIHRWEEKEQG